MQMSSANFGKIKSEITYRSVRKIMILSINITLSGTLVESLRTVSKIHVLNLHIQHDK